MEGSVERMAVSPQSAAARRVAGEEWIPVDGVVGLPAQVVVILRHRQLFDLVDHVVDAGDALDGAHGVSFQTGMIGISHQSHGTFVVAERQEIEHAVVRELHQLLANLLDCRLRFCACRRARPAPHQCQPQHRRCDARLDSHACSLPRASPRDRASVASVPPAGATPVPFAACLTGALAGVRSSMRQRKLASAFATVREPTRQQACLARSETCMRARGRLTTRWRA